MTANTFYSPYELLICACESFAADKWSFLSLLFVMSALMPGLHLNTEFSISFYPGSQSSALSVAFLSSPPAPQPASRSVPCPETAPAPRCSGAVGCSHGGGSQSAWKKAIILSRCAHNRLPRALQPPESPTNTSLKWASDSLMDAHTFLPKRERGHASLVRLFFDLEGSLGKTKSEC